MKDSIVLKSVMAGLLGAAVASVSCSAANPTTAPDAVPRLVPLPGDATVDQVLDALDARGQDFSDLTADVRLSDVDPNLGTAKTHVGQLWLVRRSPSDATLHVMFEKLIDGKFTREEKHEYLLDGTWLTDRDYHAKLETKRQVFQPGQKVDLFKLGQGAFPLPIGQDKADVHREFNVSIIAPAADDPKDSIHALLVPKPGSQLARQYSQVDVWVDRATDMPVRIDTLDAKQVNEHSTILQNVKINTPDGIPPANLGLAQINPTGWQIAPPEPYKEN